MKASGVKNLDSSNDERIARILEKMQKDIEEIKNSMKLFTLQSRSEIANELQRDLISPEKKLAYELTDGTHSAYDIAQTLRVSMTSIHRWWKDWERSGLLNRTEIKGKMVLKKRFSLRELGIEVPDISSLQNRESRSVKFQTRKSLCQFFGMQICSKVILTSKSLQKNCLE